LFSTQGLWASLSINRSSATYRPAGRCATAVVATAMTEISVNQVVEAAENLLA